MALKDFLSKKRKNLKDYYWAITIEPDWIQAAIWEIKGKTVELLAVSPPTSWGGDEDFVGAVDTALSSVVQKLPEDAKEPSKTVFGVQSSWATEGQIKETYLARLKRVCSDLSLEPTGFVVLPEAIAYLIKSREGSPLTAVVLGVTNEIVEVSVFRLGNLIGTKEVARSVSIVDDVIEGLSRFSASQEALPSRFLIYDAKEKDLEEVKQTLLSAQWNDLGQIKFLHTPKIEIIKPRDKVFAVSLAGASEIAGVSLEEVKKDKDNIQPEVTDSNVEQVDSAKSDRSTIPSSPENLGFALERDVAVERTTDSKEVQKQTPELQQKEETEDGVKKVNVPSTALGVFDKVSNMIKTLFRRIKKPRITTPKIGGSNLRKMLSYIATAGVAILIIGFASWWYLPKATVTIFVVPRELEERLSLTIDLNATSPDLSRRLLPGRLEVTEVLGEETRETTGTKTVGERSRGTVKIQNGTSSVVKLASSTKITSANNLVFTLDTSASVSAALSPSSPGTATVDVTAVAFGAEHNLAKSENFQVANYTKADLDAVATSDFSGGSSRQISTVSDSDHEELLADLSTELMDRAKKKLQENASDQDYFIEDSIISEVNTQSFSNKVGDESSTVKLDLELEVSGLVVLKSDLLELVNSVLADKVPSGFILREDQLAIGFTLDSSDDDKYELSVRIVANLLPEVKPDELARNIAGKYPSLAQDFLTNIPGFSRAEIRLRPRLPGRLGSLPRIAKNIEIEVAAER